MHPESFTKMMEYSHIQRLVVSLNVGDMLLTENAAPETSVLPY